MSYSPLDARARKLIESLLNEVDEPEKDSFLSDVLNGLGSGYGVTDSEYSQEGLPIIWVRSYRAPAGVDCSITGGIGPHHVEFYVSSEGDGWYASYKTPDDVIEAVKGFLDSGGQERPAGANDL
jgi:hypothetical protein